jgi:hypothetical protein
MQRGYVHSIPPPPPPPPPPPSPATPSAPVISAHSSSWQCPICLEGPNGEPILFHPCGRHPYHFRCLVMFLRNGKDFNKIPECALCRSLGNGSSNATSNSLGINERLPLQIPRSVVWPKLYCPVSDIVQKCLHCFTNIDAYTVYVEIAPCYHRIHSMCAIQLMMTRGIRQDGLIYCDECARQK